MTDVAGASSRALETRPAWIKGFNQAPALPAWLEDAELAQLESTPVRARALLYLSAVIIVALIVWASLAEIDEVTRGEARVVPSSQLQVVQTVDGGVVEALAVREGQRVESGALLMKVDPTRFISSMLESRAGLQALQLRAARLQALTEGRDFEVPATLEAEAPEIVANERQLYASRLAEMSAQRSIALEQVDQRREEVNEARARLAQAARGLELVSRELETTRPLVRSGAVSEMEVLRLDREVSRLRGEREQASAQLARAQSALAEAASKVEEVDLIVRNQMRDELSETMARLSSLTEGARTLEDKVRHAEIRSPVRGTVKRVLVNTVGGVVQPGQAVVEIVPLDDALILEARIKPRDIGFIHPDQQALVKFSAYDFSIYGGMSARVEHIAADTIQDEQGNPGYLVRLRTEAAALGETMPIIPGMMAEVDILTGKKTVMSYLLKPLLRAKANALSER